MLDERLLRNPRRQIIHLHQEILSHEREEVRRERAAAGEVLRRERERTAQALAEHRRAFDHARAKALEYQAILARAKRDGRKLVQILEYAKKQAA